MRLRNVKGKKEILDNAIVIIKNPEEYKGSWNKLFLNDNEINIEIGTGKCKFIKELALKNPNINYIGIEKSDSILSLAVKNKEFPSNLKLVCYDASKIDELFSFEVSKIYLNFSDPWPKKRHSKRRLTSKNFLEKYDSIFKNDKKIEFKTDNMGLFEYSLISFVDYGYKIKDLSLDLHKLENNDNILTEYEEKFSKKGFRIYKVSVYKK
ncbi:MAG: tRNA (guanosine(46)-N7)-methyltransferase TrmB [bacterium]|nr:tRNA (guanosine(46)-N7)-methyltransferase TrmB [bacterium]